MLFVSDMLKLKSTENLDQNGFNVAVLGKLADLFKTSLEEVCLNSEKNHLVMQKLIFLPMPPASNTHNLVTDLGGLQDAVMILRICP